MFKKIFLTAFLLFGFVAQSMAQELDDVKEFFEELSKSQMEHWKALIFRWKDTKKSLQKGCVWQSLAVIKTLIQIKHIKN